MYGEHGFILRGVVFHARGIFEMLGADSLGELDPSSDAKSHFESMSIVDTSGKQWRVKAWTKRSFAGLRHFFSRSAFEVELEQVGELGLEQLRARLKAAMTPSAFEHSMVSEQDQREALAEVEAAADIEQLVRAVRNFHPI